MILPRESAAPIIAAGLAYWSEWVKPFKRTPTPLFVSKEPLILHAAKLGVALGETRQTAAELTVAIFPLLEYSGLWPGWRPLLEAFPNCNDQFPLPLQVSLLNRLGQICRMLADLPRATAVHEQALGLIEQLPDEKILRHSVYFQLSVDYRDDGRLQAAKECALEAQRIVADIPEAEIGLASAYNTLAIIAWDMGQLEELERWTLMAIPVWEKNKLSAELARTLMGLGKVRLQQGRFDEAIAIYQQGLAEARKAGSLLDVGKAKYSIADAYMRYERYSEAESILREVGAELQREARQYPVLWAQIINDTGYVLIRQGRHAEAEPFLRQGVAWWHEMGNGLGEANCMDSLAEALCGQGRAAEGADLYRQALRLVISERHRAGAANLYRSIYQEYAAHCPDMIDGELPEEL